MATFCGNCGAELDSTMKVCGKCGTPVNGAKTNIKGIKKTDPEKKKKFKRKVKLILFLFILVVVGVIALKVSFIFTGTRGLTRKVMAAYEAYDIDTLILLSSDVYYYGEEN